MSYRNIDKMLEDSLRGRYDESSFDFTKNSQKPIAELRQNGGFRQSEQGIQYIYSQLAENMRSIPFSDYLKRYVYRKSGMLGDPDSISINEYAAVIKNSFNMTGTPQSFYPTTVKLTTLIKNWLTQMSVRRSVVFLLGFGLRMSVDDVNDFLIKAQREPGINPKNPFEAVCMYCYRNGLGYSEFDRIWLRCRTLWKTIDSGAPLYAGERTKKIGASAEAISDENGLLSYIEAGMEYDSSSAYGYSVTARKKFLLLYRRALDILASEYSEKHIVSAAELERELYSTMAFDVNGNLYSGREAAPAKKLYNKRLSRQRIHLIVSGKAEVDRFDLITMNFFIYASRSEEYPSVMKLYNKFVESTNSLLRECRMAELYSPNPYECFVQLCMLQESPLETYTEVMRLSYEGD